METLKVSTENSESTVTIILGKQERKKQVPYISFTEIASILGIVFIALIIVYEYGKVETKVTYSESLPVIKFMDSIGIEFPYIVLAQSIRETTYKGSAFNSPICKINSNLFGMKFNKRGYAVQKNRGHALYKNKLKSLMDYRDWQRTMLRTARKHYPIDTEEEYLYFLEHLPITPACNTRYAEDTTYVRNVRILVKQLKSLEK